ncbi:helix-turn-helix domain-containing protein [Streptomonospora nanhaiensis]|uniref:Transcriptional regulator with XRE-family HTH domain n=1 Tax=Streptomonospora nanhaiensis TaxID=1323731 RepID=A0A853BM87_9ACTN|nr:XRE family transcriptional regulator [Streptomonospora nanhaiensis]MBV2363331.1 XRE family transcriptional regulator [Streptomonospora nanhaiensis]MBX9388528.1 XRE family transcriptional regulator [Streptomonospora nanhaiensis]NYI95696.1 transcriptional regulator with XRE-family HTH domain [Streptomonospora nanhaiensis]
MGLAVQVGLRLRELRVSRGLSLSELARRSGVGKGTLSELEGGRRNPTLETLYALTTELGVPLSSALAGPAAPVGISGDAVDAVLTDRYEDADAVTETYRIRVRAAAVQHSPGHTRGTTEHVVVLSGTVLVGDPAAPVRVPAGGHTRWAADVPHVYQAPDGDAEAVLVVRYPR